MLYAKTLHWVSEFLSKLTKGLSSMTRLTWHRSAAARADGETVLQNSSNPGQAVAHRQIIHIFRKLPRESMGHSVPV